MEDEECEVLAMKETKDWRAAGNGEDPDKIIAERTAEIRAKSQLARRLEEHIVSAVNSFNERHGIDNALIRKDKTVFEDTGYANQLLKNVRIIHKKVYVKADGTFNVYVCVEMGEEKLSDIHKKLTDDQILSIDFDEHQFKQEMEKMKQEYLEKLREEYQNR
jgi:hypothetical protein